MNVFKKLKNYFFHSTTKSIDEDFCPAIKADRKIYKECLDFMSECATRGTIVAENSNGTIHIQSKGEKAHGVLLSDVLNLDLTKMPILILKDEKMLGGRVLSTNEGEIYLKIDGIGRFGDPLFAYDGIPNTKKGFRIGKLLSDVDEEGFAKVRINFHESIQMA
jgi:hypothetical protein